MLSNTQKRLRIQADLSENTEVNEQENNSEYHQGDQVYFSIPANPGETDKVWGYVLKPTSNANSKKTSSISVVVDSPIIFNRNPKYQCGSVINVKLSDVHASIPVDPNKPILRVTLEDGALIDLLRIDGLRTPINVLVDHNDFGAVYQVDHRNFRKLES